MSGVLVASRPSYDPSMSWSSAAVTDRVRLVLAVLLVPWLAAPAADAPALLLVTSLALAAVAWLHGRTAVLALRVQALPRPSAEAGGDVLLAGRVTDAPHHPLRPRAPGLV
jgi:hypothetical protein